MRINSNFGFSILTLLVVVATTLRPSASFAQSYEHELSVLTTRLEHLEGQATAAAVLGNQANFGPATLINELLYTSAVSSFEAGNYPNAISELVDYLSSAQKPDPLKHLDAQYMLGFAYEKIRDLDSARRAYLRYLETQATMPLSNQDQFSEAIERMLRIAKNREFIDDSEKNRLVSAITGVHADPQVKAEILFHAADAFAESYESSIAWLDQAVKLSQEPQLTARAMYKAAALHRGAGNRAESEKLLKRIVNEYEQEIAAREVVDLSLLSLARSLVSDRSMQLAEGFYKRIPDASPFAEQRDYELVFVLRELSRNSEALASGKAFLSKHQKSKLALNMRQLLGLIAIEAKDYAQGRAILENYLSELGAIRLRVVSESKNTDSFDFETLADLRDQLRTAVEVPYLVEQISVNAESLKRINTHIDDMEFRLRSEVFSLSQMPLSSIDPEAYRDLDSSLKLRTQVLSIGDQILTQGRYAYKDRVSAKTLAFIESSDLTRKELYQKMDIFERARRRWSHEANLEMLRLDLTRQQELVQSLRTALTFPRSKSAGATSDHLLQQLDSFTKNVSGTFARLRLEKIKYTDAEFRDEHKIQNAFAESLASEFYEFDNAIDQVQDEGLRNLKKSFRAAHKQWVRLDAKLSQKGLDKVRQLETSLIELSDHYRSSFLRILGLRKKAMETDIALNQHRRSVIKQIVADTTRSIDDRIAVYRRWIANAEFMSAQDIVDAQMRASELMDSERARIELMR